ncbi:MAG: hypothetical protein FVQ82_02730 [Planctomycetes bacterium]|nr:hypothetical protein [Planctomycetota bacterium]
MAKSRTKQISVTLPDGLYERLQTVKNSFMVSRVCQEAIEKEVYRQELILKGTQEMENVIERLKVEKEEHDEQFVQNGYSDGLDDATRLEYAALLDISKNGWNCDSYQEIFEDWLREQAQENSDNVDKYIEGWLKGVIAFWNEVKDEIER